MNTFEKLEVILKSNPNLNILDIRYFSGPDNFSDSYDNYRHSTLEGAINLMLDAEYENDDNVDKSNKSKNSIVEKVC